MKYHFQKKIKPVYKKYRHYRNMLNFTTLNKQISDCEKYYKTTTRSTRFIEQINSQKKETKRRRGIERRRETDRYRDMRSYKLEAILKTSINYLM